jgi:opine dehydrogenase
MRAGESRVRVAVSTTLSAGVATAIMAAARHDVVLHVLDGAEPSVKAYAASVEAGPPASSSERASPVVTRDARAALSAADLLVVVAETAAQRDVARAAATWLPRDAIVLLSPGGVFGALEFGRALRERGRPDLTVGETTGFMHLGRVDDNGHLVVAGVKRDLPVAFLPADENPTVAARVAVVFPDLAVADNVLVTSLANTNVIIHPAAALLSAAFIESRGGGFGFYADAFSPGAGRLVERIDAERVELLRALGLPADSAVDLFRRFYADQGIRGDTIAELLTNFTPFRSTPAPGSLGHRYFREDVPYGLVPIASLARQIGRPAVVTEAVISLCSIVCDQDFWAEGRTMQSLGVGRLSTAELLAVARRGWPAVPPGGAPSQVT